MFDGLNGASCKLTLSGEESDGGALTSSAASTANAMDVVLRVVRVIIVEHMSNVLDVFDTHKVSKAMLE